MSVETFSLIGSVFAISLLGSWHCGVMCGAFSTSLTQGQWRRLTGYHLGRLLSYCLFGGLAGLLGQQLLDTQSKGFLWTGGLLGFVLAVGLLYNLLQCIKPQQLTATGLNFVQPWLKKMMIWAYNKPAANWLFGMLSVFMPCGWLYGFLIAATTTGSFLSGSLTLFAFWLGGIPILILIPAYLQQGFKRLRPHYRPLMQALVFLSALFFWADFYFFAT